MRKNAWLKSYALFMALALVFAAVGGATGVYVARAETATYSAVYSSDNPVPGIAERVRPAVVQVINMKQSWTKQTGEYTAEQGYGSGVYIDERGYVVTNNHVVENADLIEVETLGGKRIRATIVGTDSGTDLAVLLLDEKLDAEPVPMGDSDQLVIGELAVAIGCPGDSNGVLFGTVTCGIISALDRSDINANNFTRSVNVIQTDAAINTGNSGGALLNGKGELIGIPTLKIMYDYSTVYEGLGFAVPVNTAKPIIDQLIENGKVTRPRLGVTVTNHDGPDEPLRTYPPAGVQVVTVEDGSPAMAAGLLPYDIITYLGDIRIKTINQLTSEIDKHNAGDIVPVTVQRYYNSETGDQLADPEEIQLQVELKILD